jgi:hypothetical protein
MTTKKEISVLDLISNVYEKTENCKLDHSIFNDIKEEIKELSNYFKLNNEETFFLTLIFALNYKKTNTVDFSDICKHLDSNPMQLLKYNKVFDSLTEKGYVVREKTNYSFDIAFADDLYSINKDVTQAIIYNKSVGKIKEKTFETLVDVIEELFLLSELRDDDKIDSHALFKMVENVIENNQKFDFIKLVSSHNIEKEYMLLFYLLIWNTMMGNEEYDIDSAVEKIIERPRRRIQLIQQFNNMERNALVKNELIKINQSNFITDSTMSLSEKTYSLLEEEDIKLYFGKHDKKDNGIIVANDIETVNLFFNDREKAQLSMIEDSLKEDKFTLLQERLKSKSLPIGITVLFYGYPGTGKTESVMQIAKSTGREIIKVDISQIKSKWFGDSEKLIKKIFKDYSDYRAKSDITPILLFNEADAIISKRKSIGSSAVAQTENAIQNIILEELENFEGIFMATTNLADNLDSAFDRRFLFKVEFFKPEPKVKAKIWNEKLNILSQKECEILSKKYDFTGGQINNIVRKSEIAQIINGKELNITKVDEFCSEEVLYKNNTTKIGYIK